MKSLSNPGNETSQHDKAIIFLADHYHIQKSLIHNLYQTELDTLIVNAKIKIYLSVLTIRHVKEILHKHGYINSH